jgi:hypothetical protein
MGIREVPNVRKLFRTSDALSELLASETLEVNHHRYLPLQSGQPQPKPHFAFASTEASVPFSW